MSPQPARPVPSITPSSRATSASVFVLPPSTPRTRLMTDLPTLPDLPTLLRPRRTEDRMLARQAFATLQQHDAECDFCGLQRLGGVFAGQRAADPYRRLALGAVPDLRLPSRAHYSGYFLASG